MAKDKKKEKLHTHFNAEGNTWNVFGKLLLVILL